MDGNQFAPPILKTVDISSYNLIDSDDNGLYEGDNNTPKKKLVNLIEFRNGTRIRVNEDGDFQVKNAFTEVVIKSF